jgi:HEAT repeat protein
LPPVEPPTAGFVVQLFLLPALIIGVVVVVYLLFGRISGGHRNPAEYLADLRGANEERRWLAAHELALILQHDKTWQDDQQFAGELAAELEAELDKPRSSDRGVQYQQYLASALGAFNSAVGLQALQRAIQSDVAADIRAAAIWSLARLGDRLRDSSAPGIQHEFVSIIPDLAAAGTDDDPGIRKLVAFALGAIGRPEAIDGLVPLLNDTDREVCYNAANALARLGSTLSLERLEEMLDVEQLSEQFRERESGPTNTQAQIESVTLAALESLSQLLVRRPQSDLEPLRPRIERLAISGTAIVQTSAKKLLIKMAASSAT